MKRYKLLKDTPTIKAGTIFEEVVSDFDELKELVRITPVGAKTSPQWTIQDINNFNEWFEEVKEFEEWKPERYYPYKYLDDWGSVSSRRYGGLELNEFVINTGNCYPTDTQDEVIIKEQRIIPQAIHRLKMAAKKAWFEFDGSDGPDWKNGSQRKYNIYYSHVASDMCLDSTWSAQEMTAVYFPTEASAQAIIDTMKDDLKLIFGVE